MCPVGSLDLLSAGINDIWYIISIPVYTADAYAELMEWMGSMA